MSAVLTGFIIQNKVTGECLPMVSKGANEGVAPTHVELAAPTDVCPRLFATEQSAVMALRHWLRGKRVMGKDKLTTYYPQAKRHGEQMQIVKCKVTLEWT